MEAYYLWFKALHIIAVIAWMAGMLYLPRLYVYHAGVDPGSEASQMLKVMERRLLRIIINPAMIAAFVFGGCLAYINSPHIWQDGWWHAKMLLLLSLVSFHGLLARWRKVFERDANRRSEVFYRRVNEIPTVIMMIIVLLAVIKPF